MRSAYLRALAERAAKTFCQSLGAYLSVGPVTGLYLVGWRAALSVAAVAAIYSVVTSIASTGFGPSNGPSLTGEVLDSGARRAT